MAKAGPRRSTEPAADIKARLIEATVTVLARDGFAHASARAIATEAGGVNGLIFYHFGSMDGLLAATARAITDRGLERLREGLGGDRAHLEWPDRLAEVIRREAVGPDGLAVMELLVGSRTSPVLAAEVRDAIGRAMDFAQEQLERVVGGSAVAQVLPLPLLADLAAAAFLGLEVLTQNGRQIDLDALADTIAGLVRLVTAFVPAAPSGGAPSA
ncbi:MAG: TetR/AcrR family transcriptional regulator [Acidimicrobiia bacterium]